MRSCLDKGAAKFAGVGTITRLRPFAHGLPLVLAAMLVAATATTVVARDDFRVVPAESGALVITTRAGLEAIASDLAGSYALGADIDLGGAGRPSAMT